jgi:hypothetical protein
MMIMRIGAIHGIAQENDDPGGRYQIGSPAGHSGMQQVIGSGVAGSKSATAEKTLETPPPAQGEMRSVPIDALPVIKVKVMHLFESW